MERTLFCLLLFSGLYLSASPSPNPAPPKRTYYLISRPRKWSDARRFCQNQHKDLASVRDQRDLEDLAALMGSGFTEVLIGLHRWWGWTRSEADDHKEGEPVYKNWTNNQPANQDCGGIRQEGGWFAGPCGTTLHFFCYNGSTSNVSERFVPGDVPLNWMGARAYCRDRHTDLARVRNELENQELKKLQNSMKQTKFWMGLTRSLWAWSDGTEATFTPWRPNKGWTSTQNRCAVLRVYEDSVGLSSTSCHSRKSFMCYKDFYAPLRKLVVRLTLAADGSSVDLSAPAVRESLLRQVEQTLRDQGTTGYLRVSWNKDPERTRTRDQDQSQDPGCDP